MDQVRFEEKKPKIHKMVPFMRGIYQKYDAHARALMNSNALDIVI